MQIQFWGTRGSIAKPGPKTIRYGGNTSCVEVRSDAGTLVVLDCGTGAHALGQELLATGPKPLKGYILISHTHWDHIQGLPFFAPIFVGGNEWDVFAPRGMEQSVQETLAGQMQYSYFPVTLNQLGATIRYHELVEGVFRLGDIKVTTRYLNHPALTLGYRLEVDGVSLVYSTDHEPHSRHLAAGGFDSLDGEDYQHSEFIQGADLLIHDAQYTAAEYSAKVGWGHSTVEYVVDLARTAGVASLALFHHDPQRDDESMDRELQRLRDYIGKNDAPLEVFAAAEGQRIALRPMRETAFRKDRATISTATSAPDALLGQSVLLAVADPRTAVDLSEAIRADGTRLMVAGDTETAIRTADSERPSLILLERKLPMLDGLQVCRALRNMEGSYGKSVPVVLISSGRDEDESRAAQDAGVTDWLVAPFSAIYARTRVRAWLMRTACHWSPAPEAPGEEARLRALQEFGILDTEPEERFDRLTRLTAASLDVPVALVSLVDSDRQWFKSIYGIQVRETSRESSFCAHAILDDDLLIVPDTLQDERFAHNPLVVGYPNIRFYAGCPLFLPDGHAAGTLCVIDRRPRELDEEGVRLLRDFGTLVQKELLGTRPKPRS